MPRVQFALLSLLVFGNQFLFSQNITFAVSQNFTGKNASLGTTYKIHNYVGNIGVKYHLNNRNRINTRGFLYKDNFHASKVFEHLGVCHSAQLKSIEKIQDNLQLLFVLEQQINYLGLHLVKFYSTGLYDTHTNEYFAKDEFFRPAFLSVENNLALALNVILHKKLAVRFDFGLGFIFINDRNYIQHNPNGSSTYYVATRALEFPTYLIKMSFEYIAKSKTDPD